MGFRRERADRISGGAVLDQSAVAVAGPARAPGQTVTAAERAPAVPAPLGEALRRYADWQRHAVTLGPAERVRMLLRLVEAADYRLVPVESAEPEVKPTGRQQQLLELISYGHTNPEIARRWFVSEDTIKTHANRLFRLLGAQSRAHAVRRGFELGLLKVGP